MRVGALMARIIQQFIGDKRSLALMIIAPIFILTLMYWVLDEQVFNQVGPVLVGYFAFFFVFLLAGVSFLRERTGGTLERLMVSPIKRWEIVVGYVSGFGIFALIQATLMVVYSIYVLGLEMEGSLYLVLLITILLALTALTLGILLSTFAKTELQIIQFIPLVVVPQMFFSGVFDIDSMAEPLQYVSRLMPMRYGADAMKEIMLHGGGVRDVQLDLNVLIFISLAFLLINIFALRRYRQ